VKVFIVAVGTIAGVGGVVTGAVRVVVVAFTVIVV
jgi:hypothetical protein